ncbi:AAA family ATPase [Nocardioides deserti]|uniref:AAA family ATPase n=1 Tax=Nocardioides deserti TaxID=1588644 RepID=A0ABR6U603_9ACTN|nr:AAA family ATPase [Nocardioides deserti]MBC2959825.1 AAA family ATPase [Nocardioides deserti]GGO75734.1 ABC transporter, ATP-binding protein [Nocardioides deserti]
MRFDQPPVVRVSVPREGRADKLPLRQWPMTVPAVEHVVRRGLDLAPGVTFLVGENGSGKSTIVEAVAEAYGMGVEGGSTGARHRTRPSESPLGAALELRRGIGAPRWGFFLRAETMHSFYTYLEENRLDAGEALLHEMSHGESFLEVLRTRFSSPGFYCLDEPEAALSFSSTLGLVSVLHEVVGRGGQVLCATHSPVLAAMPGATILEVGPWGLRPAGWEELELVEHWRAYLTDPQRYLRHVLD